MSAEKLNRGFWWVIIATVIGLGQTPVHASCFGSRIALDAGHSLQRPGARSARGRPEVAFNLMLAQVVATTLRAQGDEVVLVNPEGTVLNLVARTRQAQAAGADLFLSLHHDSVQPRYLQPWQPQPGHTEHYSDRFTGFSLFVSAQQADPKHVAASRALAMQLGAALRAAGLTPSLHHAEPIPGEGRILLDADWGVYRFDELIVLKTATMPAVLLEAGILVNRAEEERLRDPTYQQRIATAIGQALHRDCTDPHND
ncbi:MAG: N-acetylmuramoyl-L-alanine amidase [Gammaproteobacteria bacterium]|nr:N-acetylmuramoyl-L-alanine amidase [Gammaproteobacteria bacterium]